MVKIVKFFRLGGRFYDPPVWQIALPNMKNIIKTRESFEKSLTFSQFGFRAEPREGLTIRNGEEESRNRAENVGS